MSEPSDMSGMWIGVGVCAVMFTLMAFSGKCFRVSEEEYEKTIAEHGDFGKYFVLQQKKRYGNQHEFNNKLFDKYRHEKLVQYYAEKDRIRQEKRDKKFAEKYKDD